MEGGRTRLFCLAMQRRPPAENSHGRPLRDGDRDERRPSVTPDPSRSAWVRPIFKREGAPDHGAGSSATSLWKQGRRRRCRSAHRTAWHRARQSRRHLRRRPSRITSTTAALNQAIDCARTGRGLGHASDHAIRRPPPRARPGEINKNTTCPEQGRDAPLSLQAELSVVAGSCRAPCRVQLARRRLRDCRSRTLRRAAVRRNAPRPGRQAHRAGHRPVPPAPSPAISRHRPPRQGTVRASVCLNSSAVARMGTSKYFAQA